MSIDAELCTTARLSARAHQLAGQAGLALAVRAQRVRVAAAQEVVAQQRRMQQRLRTSACAIRFEMGPREFQCQRVQLRRGA